MTVPTSTAVAAFIDLGPLPAAEGAARLAELIRPDRLGHVVTRAIVHGAPVDAGLPAGWAATTDASTAQACAWAFEAAAELDLPLLLVSADAVPAAESVVMLIEAMKIDPLFGFALPRLADEHGRLLLPDAFSPGEESAPLRVLASLPDVQLHSERIGPGMVIRAEVVGNLPFAPRSGLSVWAALADYTIRARRIGFRPIVCNRVVVPVPGASRHHWGCDEVETKRVQRHSGEAGRTPMVGAGRAERLLGALLDRPQSLVLDARNLTPTFNGTSAAILNACDALHRAQPTPDVTLWLHPDAAAWYRTSERFQGWRVSTARPELAYAAGLRLSQPWQADDLDGLRDIAAVNVYWMLDNIAWDIGYAAPDHLDATWQRLAADADGLLFISDFSRQRFAHRFTCGPGVELEAALLSLDPSDYALPTADSGPAAPYWLVVGNRYDHKHVPATVDLLARSFPTQRLVVFGDREQPRAPRVTRFASGNVDDGIVRSCYARADVVVFPSFYEGFGLPIVEGLAYGRTVVVRDSLLVRELAAAYLGPGRLIPYTTERSLLDILGRLRRGDVPEGLAFGGRSVWGWKDVAGRMLGMLNRLVSQAPSPQMLRRTALSRGLHHGVAGPRGLTPSA